MLYLHSKVGAIFIDHPPSEEVIYTQKMCNVLKRMKNQLSDFCDFYLIGLIAQRDMMWAPKPKNSTFLKIGKN